MIQSSLGTLCQHLILGVRLILYPCREILAFLKKWMISLSRSVVTVTCVCSYTVVCLPVVLSVKLWASAFGGEIKSISAKYSGSPLLQKVFFFFFLFSFPVFSVLLLFVCWRCTSTHTSYGETLYSLFLMTAETLWCLSWMLMRYFRGDSGVFGSVCVCVCVLYTAH